MVLSETGIVGLCAFLYLLGVVFRRAQRAYSALKDDYKKGLLLGFIGGFLGMLVQGIGSTNFIITRIAGPFWFMAGLVLFLDKAGPVSVKGRRQGKDLR